ncbi:MAG: GNAT family N-acetyltransferase [Proteobacteria bacterium]|nr:GNAT family N-acetyltransferase [Pseudomonadota bacterium]
MAATAADAIERRLPLATQRLVLRRPEPADAEAIAPLAADAEVTRYTARMPHPYDTDAARSWIAEASRPLTLTGELDLVLLKREDMALIGGISLIVAGPDAGEIGYWLGSAYWGQGFASEAVQAVAAFAAEELNLERLTATVHTENVRSAKVLIGCGFRLVGEAVHEFPARGLSAPVALYHLEHAGCDPARRSAPVELPVVLVSAAALVDADGRVLLARRPPGKSMAGLWEFPGGKVHAGETPESALVRELAEELGIDTSESCLAPIAFASHRYVDFHLLMPLFVCRRWRGIVTAREGQELTWVRPARLSQYPMPPADQPLIAMLRDLL